MNDSRPDSPCIALCSTALGDNVCRGCARTFGEISQWCFMDEAERELVWARLPARQRLLRLAAACGVLLELDCEEGEEWGRLPAGVKFRIRDDGVLLRRGVGGEAVMADWSDLRRTVGWLSQA
ncbi:DUF1289 domain-containing protein [Chromobacterium sp. IIBBL 290-4]|uniref:DUF1289 domain-containing protein n=1 Tax=Chromobacterium sp. IIBBL 290-4 TaxID=2953890 RepID=UPI0020B6BB4F|nr:DUF1289 domain-containing protein [Chromobacterium sp. IIBBL 290-4]UTH74732.1 DUF1289 domain-containing protein [Chromobacterium sp. IIBBL 290-4]